MSRIFSVAKSLEKLFPERPVESPCEIPARVSLLNNDRFSFHIFSSSDEYLPQSLYYKVVIDTELGFRLESEELVPLSLPKRGRADDGYLVDKPCLVPDLLSPSDGRLALSSFQIHALLCTIESDGAEEGIYPVGVRILDEDGCKVYSSSFEVEVIGLSLPSLPIDHTEWFHQDSLLVFYGLDAWSEEHWQIAERWLSFACQRSLINTILTPVITPALDTAVGAKRGCVQLVDIAYSAASNYYSFDFSRLSRWCRMVKRVGIAKLEMPPLFTQWGAECSAPVHAKVDGVETDLFGWHVKADDPRYKHFLAVFIPALLECLAGEGFDEDHIFFHVSDEPRLNQIEHYSFCRSLVAPHVGRCRMIDALSDPDFYRKGLVDFPVVSNDHTGGFEREALEGKWVYYCVSQNHLVPNRFMALPLGRLRIMGVLIYLYRFSGFLHWGYNFYFTQLSKYFVNPYIDTSAGLAFPSGDAFIVYPGLDGSPLSSLRNEVQVDGFADLRLLTLAEQLVGRSAVVDLVQRIAGFPMDFEHYRCDAEFFSSLRSELCNLIKEVKD